MKVLYALQSTGILRAKGRKVRALDQDFVPEDTLYSVINSFNHKYALVFRHMVREVGPIAENVFEKYLGGLRETRKDVFGGIRLQKDGTLDPVLMERNLNRIGRGGAKDVLVDCPERAALCRASRCQADPRGGTRERHRQDPARDVSLRPAPSDRTTISPRSRLAGSPPAPGRLVTRQQLGAASSRPRLAGRVAAARLPLIVITGPTGRRQERGRPRSWRKRGRRDRFLRQPRRSTAVSTLAPPSPRLRRAGARCGTTSSTWSSQTRSSRQRPGHVSLERPSSSALPRGRTPSSLEGRGST